MLAYETKTALIHAYNRETGISVDTANMSCVYTPHLYRGGWVLPGFGYSTERVGVYITKADAGNPFLVHGGRQ